ncbi:MAG: virulence factor, partial [Actinomycetes bacterium]
MSEYQITSWKNIPSLVPVREGDKVVKTQLPQRFQEA